MKCFIIFVILILFTTSGIIAQKLQVREAELVKIFPIGRQSGAFGYEEVQNASAPHGPTAFCFDANGLIYISDTVNQRICVFNESFEHQHTIEESSISAPSSMEIDEVGNIIGYYGPSGIHKMDKNGKELFLIYLEGEKLQSEIRRDGFYIIDNMVIAYRKDNQIVGYNNPGTDYRENNRKVMGTEQVISEIRRSYPSVIVGRLEDYISSTRNLSSGPPERQRSNGYVIIKDGELLNRDYNSIQQMKSGEVSKTVQQLINQSDNYLYTLFEKYRKLKIDILRGSDLDRNSYWQIVNSMFVVNHEGNPIAAFKFENVPMDTLTVISPQGDVYYMFSDETGHYLYKYNRDW